MLNINSKDAVGAGNWRSSIETWTLPVGFIKQGKVYTQVARNTSLKY